jgi:hypothetical protein
MKTLGTFLSILVGIVFLSGCGGSDGEPTGTGIIQGTVDVFENSEVVIAGLLAGVTVHIDGPVSRSTVTDADGVFVFSGLPPGDYALSFEYNGEVVQYRGDSGQEAVISVENDTRVEISGVRIAGSNVNIGNVRVSMADDPEPTASGVPPAQPDGKWYILQLNPDGSSSSIYIYPLTPDPEVPPQPAEPQLISPSSYVTQLFVTAQVYARAVAAQNTYGMDARFDLVTGEPVDPDIGGGIYIPPPDPSLPPPQPDGHWYVVELFPVGSTVSTYIAPPPFGGDEGPDTSANYGIRWPAPDGITILFLTAELYERVLVEREAYGFDARFDLVTGEPLAPCIGCGLGWPPPNPSIPPAQPDGSWYILELYPDGSANSTYTAPIPENPFDPMPMPYPGIEPVPPGITRLYLTAELYQRVLDACDTSDSPKFNMVTGDPIIPP